MSNLSDLYAACHVSIDQDDPMQRDLAEAVLADPANDTPLLVLADYYDEHGDARGQTIRAAVESRNRPVKKETITLSGPTNYNTSYPPRDAKKGYVAKITGRAAGSVKYEREFLGSEATILEGDEGLYERQIGEKKGGYTRYYHVILSHPEHGLILSNDCEDDVPKIAKLLDDGRAIEDIIEVTDLRPSQKRPGVMIFDVAVRSLAAAKKAAKSATIDSATAACWDVLSLLPEPEAKKVLAELKKRISPPKAKTEEPSDA